MAKCNIQFRFLLRLTLFLQIILSRSDFLEAVNPKDDSTGFRPRYVEVERAALHKFKDSIVDPLDRLSSWVGEDCCKWAGVGCSNLTGHVVKLDVGDTRIAGTVPAQLGNLSKLQYLDLSDNHLLGTSNFNWLSGLTSLEYLNLGGLDLNTTSTSWLKVVSSLPSLSELRLSSCTLEYPPRTSLPVPIANFSSLLVVDLSSNEGISEIPKWLFNITTLANLYISGCNISGPVSHLPWYNLGNLEDLNFTGNFISDDIGLFINALSGRNSSSLHELRLSSNRFDGQLGESLGRLTSLRTLALDRNLISGEIPSSTGTLSFLDELSLSHNNMNGSIPVSFAKLSSLTVLDLSYNKINGDIPQSLGELSALEWINLANNDWKGKLHEVLFEKLRKLKHMELSCSNGDLEFDVARDWLPPFSLEHLFITGCLLGPAFPSWIRTQTELTLLRLSDVQISDTIPDWFWNLSTQTVTYLDLSKNQIGGELPSSLHFNNFISVDLRQNRLQGSIPLWPKVEFLFLGDNSLSGPIPTEIGTIMFSLRTLHLSANVLGGTIPTSITKMENLVTLHLSQNNLSGQMLDDWDTLVNLRILVLSKNKLFGKISLSMCSSTPISWLDLSDNSFEGELPQSLQNCTQLSALDLGGNKFSGSIPNWFGNMLSYLNELSLRMNEFTGEIPKELCRLSQLHALDLAGNHFSGIIPPCLGNLSGLISLRDYEPQWPYYYYGGLMHMDFNVKGRETEFTHTLMILNIIDLSNNSLTGEIPLEIRNLSTLGALNLSRNQLTGKIPEALGQLKLLETLDLSFNRLSGQIPPSMTSLSSLSALNLSFNNLSGPIPSQNQFLTLNDPSIYEGNSALCGAPLPTSCQTSANGNPDKDKNIDDIEGGDEEEDDLFWFYVSMVPGFIVGFWGVFGSLAIKRSWRIAFSTFMDEVYDKLFVLVSVKMARLKRAMKRNEN